MTVPFKFNDDPVHLDAPGHWWYCTHGHIFSRTPPADKSKACPACEDIEHLRKHRRNLVVAASVVLDQIDSAGNVPLMAAFDGRELKNLRDAIAEAREDSAS